MLVVYFLLSGGTTPGVALVAVLVAPIVGLFAMPFLFPVFILALCVVNRWQIEAPLSYGLVGGCIVGLPGLILVTLSLWANRGIVAPAQFAPLLTFAAGFSGGFTYRCVARQEMGNILT